MKALVLDAANRVSLAVIRGLAIAGWHIDAVERKQFATRKPLSFYSRFVNSIRVIDGVQYNQISANYDVVFPVSINTIITSAQLGIKNAACPPLETIRKANDKLNVIQTARKLRIGVPKNVNLNAPVFPMVIKIRDDEGLYEAPARRYSIVHNSDQMKRAVEEMSKLGKDLLCQEYIQGDGYGVSSIIYDGKLYALFCHRRTREYPSSGGPSTLCESVYDSVLIDKAVSLLFELGFNGVSMVEFKKDKRDNKYKLMEINPRFWGALPLAIKAGVNFPDILGRLTAGVQVEPALSYRKNMRLRFFFHDLVTTVRTPRYIPSFVRDLFDIEISDGIFSLKDSAPFFAQILK